LTLIERFDCVELRRRSDLHDAGPEAYLHDQPNPVCIPGIWTDSEVPTGTTRCVLMHQTGLKTPRTIVADPLDDRIGPGSVEGGSTTDRVTAHPQIGRPIWWLAGGIALLAVLAFVPAIGNGFVNWDDDTNFVDNRHFRGLGWAQIRWSWTTFRLGVYQPLSWMLLEAEYAAWGLDPRGYHLASLALYALDTAVLYALVVELLARAVPGLTARHRASLHASAGLAVALFAVHPLRTEIVAWASCQPYLPCALFLMLAVLAYLRANDVDGTSRRHWLATSSLAGLAAMMSKPVAMTLPAILLILDVYPLRRIGPGRWFGAAAKAVWIEKAVLGFIAAVVGVVALLARDSNRSLEIVQHGDVVTRVLAAGYSSVFYLVKTAVPVHIIPCYPTPRPFSWTVPTYAMSALAVLGISTGLYALRRRWPALLAAWAAYLVILVPNSGLVRFTTQLTADRYGYVSLMPMVALLAGGLFALARSPGRGHRVFVVLAGTGAVTIVGLMTSSWKQSRAWHDSITLWTYALAHGGAQSGEGYSGLGLAFQEAGRLDEAVGSYRESLRLAPYLPDTHGNLGLILLGEGKVPEALIQFREAVRLKPQSLPMQINLASCLAKLGHLNEAAVHYAEATRLDPDQFDTWNNWGLVLIAQGRLVDASARIAKAVELQPDSFEARTNLGSVLARRGLLQQAEAQFTEAVRLSPSSAQAHSRLGLVLSRLGKLREAVAELSEAIRLDPGQSAARRELERLGAGQGRARGPE